MVTLERGEAARNPQGSGTDLAVKKRGRHRPFSARGLAPAFAIFCGISLLLRGFVYAAG